MFTLKLYRNGPLPPSGRSVILQTPGIWADNCAGEMRQIFVFKTEVGVGDYDTYFVGGDKAKLATSDMEHKHYDWGVLENANGKTTEMFR
jgi:hypothetical protein